MAEQTSILKVGITGQGAKVGASEFKGAADDIKKSAKDMLKEVKQSIKDLYDEVFNFRNLIGAIGIGSVIKDIVATNVEFQRLEANLKTVTGSAMGAKAAFGELQKFAASTPFSLRGLTDAFTTLKLAGIDTSQKSLTAFGNIASSFGRDITDLARAMKSAMSGEMEALSSFGPKVVTMGNKYVITFQGMKYEIEKSGKALENFVINLGNTKFAGGMENQMQTLAGVWSNIGDNMDRLKAQVGAGGLNDALKDLLDWLNKITQGGDSTAKKLGAALGAAVRELTAALQFLVANFDLLEDIFRTLAIYALIASIASMVRILYTAAKAWDAMAMAMARNPFGLVAVAISIVLSYLIQMWQESKRAAAETKALEEETKNMVDQFKRADQSSLENVLANASAVATEIERTNDALIDAGNNTTELGKRMALLKQIETESAENIVKFISELSTDKSSQLIAQATRKIETPADLKKQLADLKDQREKMIDALVDAGSTASQTGEILSGQRSVKFQQEINMPGGGTKTVDSEATGMQVFDIQSGGKGAENIRNMGKDFSTQLADADRLMQKIDEVERKLAVKQSKVSAREAAKLANELENKLETMRAGILSLETEAETSKIALSTYMALGDSPEAQKLLAFKREYNKLTKDGTIPITAEETQKIKAATSAIIDYNTQLAQQQAIGAKKKDLTKDIQRVQWENFIDLKVPPGLQDIERQLAMIAIDLGISKEKAEEFRDALEYIAKKQGEIDKRKAGREFSKTLDGLQLQLDMMGATSVEMQKQEMLQSLLNDLKDKGVKYTQEELEGWTKQIGLIAETQQKINRLSSIKSFVQENEDLMKSLADLSVQAIDQIADAWVDFTETGKFNFKAFADFVYKEITKIVIKLLVAKAIESGISAFAGPQGTPPPMVFPTNVGFAHSGGAVSSLSTSHQVSSSVFGSAHRYALGGIPGLKPGEVPIIAHDREAIVPLPSGKGIPVDLRGAKTGGGGGNTYNFNFHGVKDFDSFRRNQSAVVNEATRAMEASERRNGTKKG